jgi:hypothetical protein
MEKICYGKLCVYLSVSGLILAAISQFARAQSRR